MNRSELHERFKALQVKARNARPEEIQRIVCELLELGVELSRPVPLGDVLKAWMR